MNVTSKYLVQGPQSTDFLDLAQTESGARAFLGDSRTDATIGPDILGAQIALRDATKKVAALVNDPTRTEVNKHIAAKKLADSAVEKLTKTKAVIENRAKHLEKTSLAAADEAFGPKPERAALHAEMRGWVRETLQRKGGEGIGIIRDAMKGSRDLADIMYHSPPFLLGGLPEDVHDELRAEVMAAHKPELHASLSTSLALTKLAGQYDTTIRKVRTSFYNPTMADQAKKRVEI
jgi:hypothetical protein